MLYAVTVEPLNSIFFLIEKPSGGVWKVQEGVALDISSNYADWPEGSPRPGQILCTSISDPKSYKLFKYSKDIETGEYRPTGMNFGGVFSPASWERFFKSLIAAKPFLDVLNTETVATETVAATDAAIGPLEHEG